MSLLSRQARGRLACLAILVAITMALVACGDGPGAKAQPEPVKILPVSFDEGEIIRRIPLVDKFSGEKLTYTAKSSNTSVATVAVDQDVLTVTAVGAGSATITVTAADSQERTATQTFRVTVPAPEEDEDEDEDEDDEDDEDDEEETSETPETPTTNNPKDCPSPLPSSGGMFKATLEITRELSGRCTLPANHSLHPPTDEGVTVQGPVTGASQNTWTITANEKGLHLVLISDDDAGGTTGEIIVRVPNTPPTWTRRDPDKVDLFDPSGYPGDPTLANYMQIDVTEPLEPGGYFEDVDKDDKTNEGGVFKYKVAYKPPELLIDTEDGFVEVVTKSAKSAASHKLDNISITVKAVVLRPLDTNFAVQLRAFDRDNAPSDNVVTLTFNAVGPQIGSYAIKDDPANSSKFKTVRMGNRIDVDHVLDFESGAFTGFVNPVDVVKQLGGDRRRIPPGDHGIGTIKCDRLTGPSDTWRDSSDLGNGCFSVKSNTTDMVITTITDTISDPTVEVRLDPDHRGLNETSDVTLTVAYHVVALSSAKSGTIVVDTTEQGLSRTTVSNWRKTLTLDIHRCLTTTDCPLTVPTE